MSQGGLISPKQRATFNFVINLHHQSNIVTLTLLSNTTIRKSARQNSQVVWQNKGGLSKLNLNTKEYNLRVKSAMQRQEPILSS